MSDQDSSLCAQAGNFPSKLNGDDSGVRKCLYAHYFMYMSEGHPHTLRRLLSRYEVAEAHEANIEPPAQAEESVAAQPEQPEQLDTAHSIQTMLRSAQRKIRSIFPNTQDHAARPLDKTGDPQHDQFQPLNNNGTVPRINEFFRFAVAANIAAQAAQAEAIAEGYLQSENTSTRDLMRLSAAYPFMAIDPERNARLNQILRTSEDGQINWDSTKGLSLYLRHCLGLAETESNSIVESEIQPLETLAVRVIELLADPDDLWRTTRRYAKNTDFRSFEEDNKVRNEIDPVFQRGWFETKLREQRHGLSDTGFTKFEDLNYETLRRQINLALPESAFARTAAPSETIPHYLSLIEKLKLPVQETTPDGHADTIFENDKLIMMLNDVMREWHPTYGLSRAPAVSKRFSTDELSRKRAPLTPRDPIGHDTKRDDTKSHNTEPDQMRERLPRYKTILDLPFSTANALEYSAHFMAAFVSLKKIVLAPLILAQITELFDDHKAEAEGPTFAQKLWPQLGRHLLFSSFGNTPTSIRAGAAETRVINSCLLAHALFGGTQSFENTTGNESNESKNSNSGNNDQSASPLPAFQLIRSMLGSGRTDYQMIESILKNCIDAGHEIEKHLVEQTADYEKDEQPAPDTRLQKILGGHFLDRSRAPNQNWYSREAVVKLQSNLNEYEEYTRALSSRIETASDRDNLYDYLQPHFAKSGLKLFKAKQSSESSSVVNQIDFQLGGLKELYRVTSEDAETLQDPYNSAGAEEQTYGEFNIAQWKSLQWSRRYTDILNKTNSQSADLDMACLALLHAGFFSQLHDRFDESTSQSEKALAATLGIEQTDSEKPYTTIIRDNWTEISEQVDPSHSTKQVLIVLSNEEGDRKRSTSVLSGLDYSSEVAALIVTGQDIQKLHQRTTREILETKPIFFEAFDLIVTLSDDKKINSSDDLESFGLSEKDVAFLTGSPNRQIHLRLEPIPDKVKSARSPLSINGDQSIFADADSPNNLTTDEISLLGEQDLSDIIAYVEERTKSIRSKKDKPQKE